MSLFFLILSTLTYFVSHFWAKRTKPHENFSFSQIKKFSGTLKEFETELLHEIGKNPQLLLLEKGSKNFLVSQAAGFFTYGYFYHISCIEEDKHLIITLSAQPKLVSHPTDKKSIPNKIFSTIELNDVG